MQLQVVENKESQELLENIKQILASNSNYFKGRLNKVVKKKKKKDKVYPRLILQSGEKITDINKISFYLFANNSRTVSTAKNDDIDDIKQLYNVREKNIQVRRDEGGKILQEKDNSADDDQDENAHYKEKILQKSKRDIESRSNRQKPSNLNNSIGDVYQEESAEKRVEENLQEYFQNEFKKFGSGAD